jgi:hypothetical protein
MALPPNRYKCLDLLELEKVEIDAQSGNLKFQFTDSGVQLATDYMTTTGWLQGYFTASNFYRSDTPGDLTKGTRPHQWMTWIFSYCRRNPSATLIEAASELATAFKGNPKN